MVVYSEVVTHQCFIINCQNLSNKKLFQFKFSTNKPWQWGHLKKVISELLVQIGSLRKFSEIGRIYFNLDGFSKLGIGPKYEPIRTLQKVTTSWISLANSIGQNEHNLSVWLWKIRQPDKVGQSDHSNGWKFRNYEPMGTLEVGTTSWINLTNTIALNK